MASGVAGEIELESLPVVAGCAAELAATGGDDYELCFTVAPQHRSKLPALPDSVSVIGRISEGRGVVVRDAGRPVTLEHRGFRHFS